MHLYKRKKERGKIWWYKFMYHGVVYQASTGFIGRYLDVAVFSVNALAQAARLAIDQRGNQLFS